MIETATGEGTGTLRGVIQKIIETDEVPQEHGAITIAPISGQGGPVRGERHENTGPA